MHTQPTAPATITALIVPDFLQDFTDCEVVDYERVAPDALGDGEWISVAVPRTHGHYLRVGSLDLVRSIEGARWLLDKIEAAVLDARQQARESAMVLCSYCISTMVEPDEECCGSADCARAHAADCIADMDETLRKVGAR